MKEIDNYQEKNIKDFTSEDTLYIQKTQNGYTPSYYVKFISIERGIVKGEVISVEPDWWRAEPGTIITARLSNCYLFSKEVVYGRCKWFDKTGFAK